VGFGSWGPEKGFSFRNAENIRAVIGPAVGPCCYVVDEPVAAAFREMGERVVWKEGNKWRIDLWEANRQILIESGVPPESITVSGICTSCSPELFYSHRRDGGITGRMAAVVMVRRRSVGLWL